MSQTHEINQEHVNVGSFEDWLSSRQEHQMPRQSHAVGEVTNTYTAAASPRRQARPKTSHVHAVKEMRSPFYEPVPPVRTTALREVETGPRYLKRRREIRVRRGVLFFCATMVCLSAIVSVVARAEIAKMSLQVDHLDPTLTALQNANYQLSLQKQSLQAPARIAAFAQTQLHMQFPDTGSTVTNTANANSLISSRNSSYGLYYTPNGSPTTTEPTSNTSRTPSAQKQFPKQAQNTAPFTSVQTTNTTSASVVVQGPKG